MHINWGALLIVAFVSFGSAVGVVALIAFALLGLSARAGSTTAGHTGIAEDGSRIGLSPTAGTLVAALCLLAAAVIVGYGLWIIIG